MKNLTDFSAADFGCTDFIATDKLPRRCVEVGGSLSYKVGDTLELLGVGTFPAINAGDKPYQAVCALINGTPSQVSIPTLLGDIFVLTDGKSSRVKVDNKVNHLPIKDLLGKTLKIASLQEYKAKAFNRDASAPVVEVTKSAPIFEPVV